MSNVSFSSIHEQFISACIDTVLAKYKKDNRLSMYSKPHDHVYERDSMKGQVLMLYSRGLSLLKISKQLQIPWKQVRAICLNTAVGIGKR